MKNVDGLLQKGMAALQGGRLRDAERSFRQAVEIAPRHFGALNLLTVALTGLERFDEAEAFAERALRIDASSDATHYNYGTVLKHNNKLEQAIAAFDAALAINPRHAKALNNRGAACSQLERYEEAIADFDRALALDRRYGDACYNKANALMALKRREEALRNFESALSLNPRHAGAYANLVMLFAELGDYAKAAECGRRALALEPDLTEAYLNLAAMEQSRSHRAAGLKWLDALVARRPDDLLGLCARVALLVRLDRIDDARKDFERAKALTPRDAKERAERDSAAATLLLADARYDEAISAYESAVAAPDQVRERLMLARATMLEMFGQKDAALWAFEQALEFYPLSGGAWFGRADLVKFTRADPAIAAMEALLAPEAQPSFGDRTHLNFALGKAFLDIGDSPAAFRHLHEGNRLKRTVTSYDSEEASRQLAAIAEAFTPELLNRLAGLGARSSTPIFVVGMPRSGATLIEQILAAHSAIRGAGELPYVGRIVEELDEFPASVASLDGERFKRLGEDYLSRVSSAAEGKTRVVDKMPGNFALVGLIRLILPDAKIIHSRRNPVDACLSCYSKLFSNGQNFSYDLIELGRYHRDYQTLMAHWRAVLPPSHFLEVDYEAVVDDVEAEARRMLEFLELPWDPACLEFYRVERPVRTASVNQVRQPIYRTSSGRWRQHADELRPLLQALGIETA